MLTTYERYHAASAQMDALIEMTPTPTDHAIEAVRQRAEARMSRLEAFLARLGNPQRGYPIVHIGGTSGKGSTSTTLAAILTAAGYRTGLHTSPYLQTPLEKLQVDGRLCAPETFIAIVDEFTIAHDRWLGDGQPALTYGEGWGALTWLFFRHERVDVAVVEVGAGGRFDLTNILHPALSVITSVGIDHTQTLGTTIPQIAWHKAGIIKRGVPAVSAVPDREAQAIIAEEASTVEAPLIVLDLDNELQDVRTSPDGTSWREASTGRTHRMRMCGSFQSRNGQTAIVAARTLRDIGYAITDEAIETGLMAARIPGRAEIVPATLPVLLDGAHNAEKVAAFAKDIPSLLPDRGGRRIGVVGLLSAKKADAMVRSLVPHLDVLIATSPRVLGKDARDAADIRQMAEDAGFTGEIATAEEPEVAIGMALDAADAERDSVLVTGSLYLVGNIRERWYPEPEMVAQATAWPRVAQPNETTGG